MLRESGYGFETGFDGIRTCVIGKALHTKHKRSASCVIFVGRYSKIKIYYFCPKDAMSASISLSLATSSWLSPAIYVADATRLESSPLPSKREFIY